MTHKFFLKGKLTTPDARNDAALAKASSASLGVAAMSTVEESKISIARSRTVIAQARALDLPPKKGEDL